MTLESLMLVVVGLSGIASLIATIAAILRSQKEGAKTSHDNSKQRESNLSPALPLFVLMGISTLTVILLMFFVFLPPPKRRHILFQTGSLFESSEHATNHTRFIEVYSVTGDQTNRSWGTQESGAIGYFSYRTDPRIRPTGLESSGGYVTFYPQPIDKLQYQTLRFECKGVCKGGTLDLGIRLVVDDPNGVGDRELATHELASITEHGTIREDWRLFEIPLSAFRKSLKREAFPPNLDANKLNKIVVFIDV